MARVEKTIFISYRRTNAPWALAICQNLNNNGYDVFFDFNGIAKAPHQTTQKPSASSPTTQQPSIIEAMRVKTRVTSSALCKTTTMPSASNPTTPTPFVTEQF
jgi:hypothetical protein